MTVKQQVKRLLSLSLGGGRVYEKLIRNQHGQHILNLEVYVDKRFDFPAVAEQVFRYYEAAKLEHIQHIEVTVGAFRWYHFNRKRVKWSVL